MQLSSYIQAVTEDLGRIAAVGDEQTGRVAEALAIALESSLARHFQEALTEAALELSAQLEAGRVEVRVAGGDPELVYVEDDEAAPTVPSDAALAARITLRLPESVKSRLEAAATAAGVSVNTWIVQLLSRSLEPRSSVGGARHRLTGYGRS
jgi:predicted HicB family RNase H-like nuclease